VGACGGGDDGGDRAATRTTTTTARRDEGSTTTTQVPAVADGYAIDEAVLGPSWQQADQLFGGVDGASIDDFRPVARQACAEVRSGAASGRPADRTAAAVVQGVPTGPGDRRFVPVAILATELYLEGSKCGADPTYAGAVREALHPLANQAFLDAATP
jgi:hypothetical protein